MAKYNDANGHWITTKDGRHLFISDEENLVDKQDREIKANQKVAKELNDEKNSDVIVARLPGKNYVTVSSVDDLFKKWGFQRDSNFIKGNLAYSWSRHEDNPNFNRYSVHTIDDYGNVNGFVGRYVVGNTQYNVQAMVDDAEKKVAKWAKKKAANENEKQIEHDKKVADDLNGKKQDEKSVKNTDEKAKPLTKSQQLDIILKTNPADDELGEHTWIREESDILTYKEAIEDTFGDEIDDFTPDFTADDIKKALKTGKITVYSSKPIINGNFVTPSAMEAAAYAGDAGIYTATIDLSDVAWIDEGQGQLATNNKIDYTKRSSKGLI